MRAPCPPAGAEGVRRRHVGHGRRHTHCPGSPASSGSSSSRVRPGDEHPSGRRLQPGQHDAEHHPRHRPGRGACRPPSYRSSCNASPHAPTTTPGRPSRPCERDHDRDRGGVGGVSRGLCPFSSTPPPPSTTRPRPPRTGGWPPSCCSSSCPSSPATASSAWARHCSNARRRFGAPMFSADRQQRRAHRAWWSTTASRCTAPVGASAGSPMTAASSCCSAWGPRPGWWPRPV